MNTARLKLMQKLLFIDGYPIELERKEGCHDDHTYRAIELEHILQYDYGKKLLGELEHLWKLGYITTQVVSIGNNKREIWVRFCYDNNSCIVMENGKRREYDLLNKLSEDELRNLTRTLNEYCQELEKSLEPAT